jgi:toxin ParE1/3/4
VARTVVWTESASHDVEAAADFIARDSRYYAAVLAREALQASRSLRRFAERGRIVPESNIPEIRELFVQSYRLIFKVTPRDVQILAFIHTSRDLKERLPALL